jgi:hypothetical protein
MRSALRDERGPLRNPARLLVLLAVMTIACGSPAAPSADLNGGWDLTFSAFSQVSCPGQPDLVPGCAGSGQLNLVRTTPQIDATHSYRAFCQSCRGALDYGVTEQPLRTARLTGGALQFALAGCRFDAEVPAEPAQMVAGAVVCTLEDVAGLEIRGNWAMSRR